MLRIGLAPVKGTPTDRMGHIDSDTPPTPQTQDPDEQTEQKSPAGPGSPRFDIEKIPQQLSGYMGPEAGPFECEHCTFFSGPRSCHVVSGDIDPHGCCNNFTPGGKPESDESPEEEAEEQETPEAVGPESAETGEM